MSAECPDEELTPEQQLFVADLFYKVGVVICLFVGAAVLTGTPVTAAGKYAPPGLLSISFALLLRDTAEIEEDDEVSEA